MKRVVAIICFTLLTGRLCAQDIISIVTEGITKVVRAVDLQIQRIQTRTIILQEAQKEVENAMSELRLGEIQDWTEQLKDLYANYFQELWQVKDILSGYHRVKEAIQRQEEILSGCQRGANLFRQNTHFSGGEVNQISSVYSGMLTESIRNLELLTNAIQAYALQMTDRDRMALIDEAAGNIDRNYRDMQVFTNQNELISLQRASDENDYITLKKLYGL